MVYNIFWKEVLIGILEINTKGEYKFTRHEDMVETASNDGMPKSLVPGSTDGFVDPKTISFFYERISRSTDKEEIGYFTDFFRFRKV